MFFSSEKASLFKKKIVLSFIPIFSPISVQRVQRKSFITSCTLNLGRINWASRIVPRFVRDEEVELTSTFPLFNMFFLLCFMFGLMKRVSDSEVLTSSNVKSLCEWNGE